jgi:hypothetical protein
VLGFSTSRCYRSFCPPLKNTTNTGTLVQVLVTSTNQISLFLSDPFLSSPNIRTVYLWPSCDTSAFFSNFARRFLAIFLRDLVLVRRTYKSRSFFWRSISTGKLQYYCTHLLLYVIFIRYGRSRSYSASCTCKTSGRFTLFILCNWRLCLYTNRASYTQAMVNKHDNFNFYASQLRIRIEMAFGLMVKKWGILSRPLTNKLKHLRKMVIAIC